MIQNLTRQTTIATDVEIAKTFWQRSKGLLGRESLEQGKALVIPYCESIHMFFMKFPIDVIFCDRNHKVVGLCADVKPFQMSPIFFKASYAIELPTGSIASSNTQKGDTLKCPLSF